MGQVGVYVAPTFEKPRSPVSLASRFNRRSVRLLGENLFASLEGRPVGPACGCTQQARYVQYITFAPRFQWILPKPNDFLPNKNPASSGGAHWLAGYVTISPNTTTVLRARRAALRKFGSHSELLEGCDGAAKSAPFDRLRVLRLAKYGCSTNWLESVCPW